MENIFLKQLASRDIITSQEDINAPFSFIEWKQRRLNYAEADIVYHYNQYVVGWFSENKSKPVSQKFLLRQKYLYLLSQLQLFFSDEEKNQWYNKVNLSDEKELLLAIPYFAKKLKTIALYYLRLRKKLKNTKLRYNLVGTETGLAQEIQNRLMEVFSSLNTELPPEIQNNLPNFEDLQNNFTVQIDQLYDDSIYFDRDPSVALSAYYDPFHQATADFFATKGLTLSSDEWIFNSFNVPVTADLDVFVSQLTGNVFEQSDANSYGSFIQKFLGESKFLTAFSSSSSVTTTTDVTIASGSNYFYYPYGLTNNALLTSVAIPQVALSSIAGSMVASGATASASISGSDTIYVKIGEEVKPAWLKYTQYTTDDKTLEADLIEQTTSFIFPFPGYGLSAEDVEWTGPSLSSTPEYQFLAKEFKNATNDAYWYQTLPSDDVNSIFINDTTLVKSGAYADKNPMLADQLYLRERNEADESSSEIIDAAWLYKMDKTSIPVSVTTSTSALLWPIEYISDANSDVMEHIKELGLENMCSPVRVADLSVPFAVASDRFENAERIFKLQKYKDLSFDSTECCWLSSRLLSSDSYAWNDQGGFSVTLSAGSITKFVWGGQNNTPLSAVFTSIQHAENCPFVLEEDVSDPSKCNCNQVFYSPYGHNGFAFTENNSEADYIAVDTANDLDPFDIGSWRDDLLSNFENSAQFAWYKTTNKKTWGDDGSWVTTNFSSPFLLETGKAYFYKRTTSRDNQVYPPYIINFQYPNNNTKWIEAQKTLRGEWVSTGRPSEMKLYPGDLVRWEKQKSNTFYHLSSTPLEITPANLYSKWSSVDLIPIDSKNFENALIIWPPFPQPLGENRDEQYPLKDNLPVTFADVEKYYYWKITRLPSPDQFKNLSNSVWTEFDVLPFGSTINVKWPVPEQIIPEPVIIDPEVPPEPVEPIYVFDGRYPVFDERFPSLSGRPVLTTDINYIHWWKVIITTADTVYTEYYQYPPIDFTYVPTVTGTFVFEVSAKLIYDNEDYYYQSVPSVFVPPLTSYYFYDSVFVTFSPIVTGTYSVEVSAKLFGPQFNYNALLNGGPISSNGEDYFFSNIPLITAVSLNSIEVISSETKQPASGYMLQQSLSGWDYTTSTPNSAASGARPYWAALNLSRPDVAIYGSGYPKKYIDGYLPNSAPIISPINLRYGQVIDYKRKGQRFTWKQPLKYETFTNSVQWYQISSQTLSSSFEPFYFETEAPTDIVLSNFINGKPVEVFYNAKNSFVWQVSVDVFQNSKSSDTTVLFNAEEPWNVLSNRFYPTIATVPITENLYSEKESGGFFTHTKLGASQYINDNFTPVVSANYYQQTFLTEDTTKHIGGRGLTKKEQDTIYGWEENNQWLKEPSTANQLAGAVKKSLTKSLQTFVPYQNTVEQKQFGLITPTSRTSPWGGSIGDQWTDTSNEPKSFTGVHNVSAWADKQILKQNQKVMDSWVTDIFGNQYGLFKAISSDADIYHRTQVGGQLWVRTNDQIVKPAYVALSAVFDPFKTINASIYQQLTGEGITYADCFFDTLVLQTSSAAIYSKLSYNYDDAIIEASIDNTRFKLLTSTDLVETKAGQTWFFPTEKSVFNVFTTISANQLIPELFELDLVNNTFIKQFPYSPQQQASVISSLSSLSVQSVDIGLLTYSKQTQQFLISIPGKLTNGEQFLIDIILNDREQLDIESITIYADTRHPAIPFAKKITVTNDYFYDEVPFEVPTTSTIIVPTRDTVIVSISAINDPTYFEIIGFESNITTTNDGTFSIFFEKTGLYHVNYKVGNVFGYNMSCLTLSAVDREDVILLNGYDGFLKLNGYNGRYIVHEH